MSGSLKERPKENCCCRYKGFYTFSRRPPEQFFFSEESTVITCYTFSHQSPIVNVNNLVSYFTDGRVMEQKTNREREKIIFFHFVDSDN